MKKVWKQVLTAMLAMLLLAGACGAYAENDPQKLLAGLADYLTNDEWWGQKEFCTEWKTRFGLTGEFELMEQSGDEETKFCDLAYQLWVEKCGITNENDYSLASMGYLVRVTEGDASRDYWLVSRDHGEMMNFYVLYDRGSEEALATTWRNTLPPWKRRGKNMRPIVRFRRRRLPPARRRCCGVIRTCPG